MGNWCSSSRKEPASSVTMVHRENPKKALTDRQLTGVMVASEYNTMVLGASSNGEIPANSSSSSGRGSFGKEPKVPTVLLLPHQHTLFCERKVRRRPAAPVRPTDLRLSLCYSNACAQPWAAARSSRS